MKKFVALILSLMLCLAMAGCGELEQSTLEKYVDELSLKDSWVTTMEDNIPDFDSLENIESEGTSAYKVTLSNGEGYYVVIGPSGEVVSIMTDEEDYNARTKVYEAY